MRSWLPILVFCVPVVALARPPGPATFCDARPDSPTCAGAVPSCDYCHLGVPPARNDFGAQIAGLLLPEATRPLDDAAFAAALPDALDAIGALDADGDGASNEVEIAAGTLPADPESVPEVLSGLSYDPVRAWRKLWLDVCGRSPDYEALQAFAALEPAGQMEALHDDLDACLDSEWWAGEDGVVWRLAHDKIRPIQAVKSGRNSGVIPLGDYDDDYRLFVYAHTGDRDARDVLRADYFVIPGVRGQRFAELPDRSGQDVPRARRNGLITTRWFLLSNTMFTAIPRTSAAQAYRAFLGLDIARLEGLLPAVEEPEDFDEKGVKAPACAVCHTTLDPATYPFTRYTGLGVGNGSTYRPDRLGAYRDEGERMDEVPEAGVVLGQPVADLNEWADVAANSEQFARATVADYWRILVGHPPTPAEQVEFDPLWRAFMDEHDYRIERMLHALVETEAYGAP